VINECSTDEKNRRYKSEVRFHDRKASKNISLKSFYNQGALNHAWELLLKCMGTIHGEKVLDFGCGMGWATEIYARAGAEVTGIDISMGSIFRARQRIQERGLSDRVRFVQASGEQLPFIEYFDLVVGVAILHHLELASAVASIRTVLKKKGGRAVFMEPLGHNPLINLFRKLTPSRRTRDECPLPITFLNMLKNHFESVEYHAYGLLALLAYLFIPLRAHGLFCFVNRHLSRLDDKLFELAPFLRKYAWGCVIEVRK
jgi:SAM-dependent methyltransferase